MTYFLTFATYGTHLPGDSRGSFDHARLGESKFIAPNGQLERHRRSLMVHRSISFSAVQRRIVCDAIVAVCAHRSWFLHALHVRTEHVHGVVDTDLTASRVLNDWKAYASRALRSTGLDGRVWAHGGHARPIRSAEARRNIVRYVFDKQGEPMERYCAECWR